MSENSSLEKTVRAEKPNASVWLKEYCTKIVKEKNLIDRLARIAAGEGMERTQRFDPTINQFATVMTPAPLAAQVSAMKELLDRGWGKPEQAVAVTGDVPRMILVRPGEIPLKVSND